MFDLEKKIAVITGAGSGIGKATAELFASRNAKVFLLDLNEQALNEVRQAVTSNGGEAYPMPCNVAEQAEVLRTFQEIIQQESRIDILVNCAGIAHIGKLESTPEKDFDRIYHVN
ncbi:MAG TPA: SDR family oxidoreductase, partial [Chryseosolibacter sp.]